MTKENQFDLLSPNIFDNSHLRAPQREGYEAIRLHYANPNSPREVGLVLPVGCGKSGLITISPFAVKSARTLIVAPNVPIANQLQQDLDPTGPKHFYQRCAVLPGPTYPELAELRGNKTNQSDLNNADVVVTNIQQLQGIHNKWLLTLPPDFFDMILVDEGHHNVADSWDALRIAFPKAKIVNFSATPARSDGQVMTGDVIYSYPIFKAIEAGFVKRLKAVVLNPEKLKYIHKKSDQEIELSLEEVKKLGEEDADFRRSIVSSKETLDTIVNCSIRELQTLREKTGDKKHKIIASALTYSHCIQIVQAYESKGLRAAYIHSKEDGFANQRILKRLESHDLDAIVQVRKLGEGFDHPYLSVAAVCSVFSNLSPFVQFVGRIMRSIVPSDPTNGLNRGVVVFHAGANIARLWSDFQLYSKADQDFFDQLLPQEELSFKDGDELVIDPVPRERHGNPIEIKQQSHVRLLEIPLLENDQQALDAIALLRSKGYSAEQVSQAMLQPLPTTKQKSRQAAKQALDSRAKTEVGRALFERGIKPKGKGLDPQRRGRENFQVLKSEVDNRINALVGRKAGERSEFTQQQLDLALAELTRIVNEVAREVIDAKA